jgi:transcriptional regulator with XRE-family HTH domain
VQNKEQEEKRKLNEVIGSRLAALRKKAGYTNQDIFAYDAGITRALYSRYEKGNNLTIFSLYKILKFHGITFKTFFSKGFEEFDDMPLKGFEGYSRPKPASKSKTGKKKAPSKRR